MALDVPAGRRSASPESSGRDSPVPRQWRNQLGADEPLSKDKAFRKYASGVERALALFETALQEWADYISFLNRLLKALQARQPNMTTIPAKSLVAKRLSQCLNPSLPSGVHQKTLEVYNYVFSVIGQDGVSRDLPLYLPGLAPTLSFASLSARAHFFDLMERHFLDVHPQALRPALKSLILALLPGLEDETAEDFDRTLKLLNRFKRSIRPPDSQDLTPDHATGDDFFWQCFFLASITSQSRRPGALAYLSRYLPKLGQPLAAAEAAASASHASASVAPDLELHAKLSELVAFPEPGLLIRCFASGLADEQLLIQRGFLDLLVAHLPLHSAVLQTRVKPADVELLMRAACGVVTRREMSLNRRLMAWLLGPDPPATDADSVLESPTLAAERHSQQQQQQQQQQQTASPIPSPAVPKTSYFEEFGLQPLTRALLDMVKSKQERSPAERARPYRICLSLMDRWEIGGLVVPEVFLPIVDSVRKYKETAASPAEFTEVLRSASVFFDGVESGLIYGEMLRLVAQAIGPGKLAEAERADKLALVKFILHHFNVREEEMVTIHAPLSALSILAMLEDTKPPAGIDVEALKVVADLLDLVPDRAFHMGGDANKIKAATEQGAQPQPPASNTDILTSIRDFYIHEQGNLDAASAPYTPLALAELLLCKASRISAQALLLRRAGPDESGLPLKSRVFVQILDKVPSWAHLDVSDLLAAIHSCLSREAAPFLVFSSVLSLAIHLHMNERIATADLSGLVPPLVGMAWRFLGASEPKYHVETVRRLWLLQTALGTGNRDIEATVAQLMTKDDVRGTFSARSADPGRRFAVLWLHTLQDSQASSSSGGGSGATLSDRRAAKAAAATAASEKPMKPKAASRLAGAEHYGLMLTRPLLLMLDALLDERTQLFMTIKAWLNAMVGIDRVFLILLTRLLSLDFFQGTAAASAAAVAGGADVALPLVAFTQDDDLDLCLYYLRILSNVFRFAPEAMWGILSRRTVRASHLGAAAVYMAHTEDEVSFQDLFVHVCIRCIMSTGVSTGSAELERKTAQLCRYALSILHQILLSPHAASLSGLHLQDALLERLQQSFQGPDPYIQVLLLDVLYASLKLREIAPATASIASGTAELPPMTPTTSEKRATAIANQGAAGAGALMDPTKSAAPAAARLSEDVLSSRTGGGRRRLPPPPALLKCIQEGLSSPSSRAVLESWVSFLAESLVFYADSIFQVLIPLVETLCHQISSSFSELQRTFQGGSESQSTSSSNSPDTALFSLLNALEQLLATAHERLLAEEARAQAVKSPDQPQSFFGTIFAADVPQTRSATANDRLTVLLAFQDAVRICFEIWSWGKGGSVATAQDATSAASFTYISLRMRNRARRLLEHLFAAETLECLETVIDIWRAGGVANDRNDSSSSSNHPVFDLLPTLDGSRPKHTIPAIFNAIYSRTNPGALDPARQSTLTISLQDTDIVVFLVDYARSLEDDAMDEIWQDCTIFLKDLLGNPFPHRQSLPCLLEFTAILGEKVDNTNFGEQRKMRRDLGDLFLRLLTALFTTRPVIFADTTAVASPSPDKSTSTGAFATTAAAATEATTSTATPMAMKATMAAAAAPSGPAGSTTISERADDVVSILSYIVPNLPKILTENDRVLTAATVISANVIGPAIRAKGFPETVSRGTLALLQGLAQLPNNQKGWKKDVADAFHDARFFSANLALVRSDWLALLRQWAASDKERMAELLGRLTPPTTAGIVFGVGATSARLEADRRTQLTLRRVALLVLAGAPDAFVAELPALAEKLVELLGASARSSPSSTTRAEVYMVLRALVLRTSAVPLAGLWPVIDAELHAAVASLVAPEGSLAAETYNSAALLQACKLLDLLVCVAHDDFQLHEWLFVTDTIDAVYRPTNLHYYQPVALADEVSEVLRSFPGSSGRGGGDGGAGGGGEHDPEAAAAFFSTSSSMATTSPASGARRRPLLGVPGGLSDEVGLERKDELVAKVLRPFFSQLSIYAFESTYTMEPLDLQSCEDGLLKDLFDERAIVKAI